MSMSHLRYSGQPLAVQRAALEAMISAEPVLMAVLERAQKLDLPDWFLVSGAIYNMVWNRLTGRPSLLGVKDADLFYCDTTDLSYAAEDAVICRAVPIFADLPIPVEIRNQARVHLWYEDHFGVPSTPIRSSREGIERFACFTHSVGVRLAAGGAMEVYAPYGLDDMFSFRLAPNRARDNRRTHESKASRQILLWPELTVEPW